MKKPNYEICGTHRGGTDHAKLLLEKGKIGNLNVRLVDPEPGRSKALMPLFSRHGVPAAAVEARAPLTSDASVRVLAMDDVQAMARIVERPVQTPLLESRRS